MVYLRNIEFLSKYLRVFSKEAFLAAAGWILLMRGNYINLFPIPTVLRLKFWKPKLLYSSKDPKYPGNHKISTEDL